jgi:pre-mRNA-splicing helicase BRR2
MVVGDPSTKTLLAIKRVTLQRKLNVKLEIACPRAGQQTFQLFTMCDSFLGCDQEIAMELTVGEGEDDSDEEDEDEDEDGDVEMAE